MGSVIKKIGIPDKKVTASYLNYVFLTLSSLVITLFFMSGTDDALKTAWLLLLSFSSFVGFADFGFSPVIQRFFAYHIPNYKKKEFNEIKTLYTFSLFLYLTITVILVLYLYISYNLSYKLLVNKNPSLGIPFVIHSIGLIVTFFGKIFSNTLLGLNNVYEVNYKNAIINALKFVLIVGALFYFRSLLIIVSIIQLANFLIVATNFNLVQKKGLQATDLTFVKFRELFKEVWPTVWRGGLGLLLGRGILEFTNQILVNILSEDQLNGYLFNLRIIIMITTFSAVLYTAYSPSLVNLRKNADLSLFRNTALEVLNKVLIIYSLIFLCYYLFVVLNVYPPVTKNIGSEFLLFMGFIFFLERHHGTHMHLYSTLNREPWYIFSLISGAIFIATLLILKPSKAVSVILIYGSANLILSNWYSVVLSIRSMNLGLIEYLKSISIFVPMIWLIVVLIYAFASL